MGEPRCFGSESRASVGLVRRRFTFAFDAGVDFLLRAEPPPHGGDGMVKRFNGCYNVAAHTFFSVMPNFPDYPPLFSVTLPVRSFRPKVVRVGAPEHRQYSQYNK